MSCQNNPTIVETLILHKSIWRYFKDIAKYFEFLPLKCCIIFFHIQTWTFLNSYWPWSFWIFCATYWIVKPLMLKEGKLWQLNAAFQNHLNSSYSLATFNVERALMDDFFAFLFKSTQLCLNFFTMSQPQPK